MKFLIFSAQYLPHLGGIESFTDNLSKKLKENGHDVVIVTSNTTSSPSYELVKGIDVYRFDCLNLIDGRFPIFKKNQVYKNILERLDIIDFDFVIINARFYFHSIFAAKYAKKRNIPCICIDHGTSHLTVHNPVLDFMGGLLEHFLTRILKLYCSDFYGVSKASSDWLSHFHIQSKGQIYNAINFDDINLEKNRIGESYRNKYKISDDAICVSFTGRLLKEKGIIQMVNGIIRWNQKHVPVYCLIAGDGPLLDYLTDLQDPHIIALGRLSFHEVVHLLQETDIFCLASDSEGFSTSLLEAAVCKNYIITTARGGAKEVLLNDNYGIVIKNNDEESVYNALSSAFLNENRSRGIDLTYANVVSNFTWDVTVNRVIEIAKLMQ